MTSQPRDLKLSNRAGHAHRIFGFALRLGGKLLLAGLLVLCAATAGLATGAYLRLHDLPDVRKLAYYDPPERSEIVTTSGMVLKQIFGEENRKVVHLRDVPRHVPNAILAIEDARFREHLGVDPIGILRAFKANLDSSETVQGGSTITQQVVKNLFLTPERSYARKAAEAVLSVRVDQTFSKDQILELYANLIYFGHNAYGIQAAAETYFGKDAQDLSLGEAAMIAGLIRGPEIYSPYRNYAKARARQAQVLDKMAEYGFVSPEQALAAKKAPIRLYGIRRTIRYPYFTTFVMDYLRHQYSRHDLETKGLRIVTSLDPRMQAAARRELGRHVQALASYNIHQGALVTIEATTGYIKAIVGGTRFGYGKNEFNRAWQARRQTGSSFKPFVYATGFENGLTPDSVIADSPVTYPDGAGRSWSPQNYGRSFSGPVTVRQALMNSINVVAVKVMDQVGIPKVIAMTQRLGITSEVRPYLSSALGASEITPLEMAHAYSAFANDGVQYESSPIYRIRDKHGQVIYDNTHPTGKRVLGQDVVRALDSCLQSVVAGGTGYAARIPGHQIAGKTGTTSSHKDAWFMGFTPHYVTAVWVGNDDNQRMYGATGGAFCAPIWHDYMSEVLKTEKPRAFPQMLPLHRKLQLGKGSAMISETPEQSEAEAHRAELPNQRLSATPLPVRTRIRSETPTPPESTATPRQPAARIDPEPRRGISDAQAGAHRITLTPAEPAAQPPESASPAKSINHN